MTRQDPVFLNRLQRYSLNRLGNLYLPGDEQLPCFSDTGCIHFADDILGEIHPDDRRLLGLLLYVLVITPVFLLRLLLRMQDHPGRYPAIIATLLRLTSLATKGVVMSLYFSGLQPASVTGPTVLERIDYHLHCEPDEVSSRESS